jgi:hypothetical protein
LHAFDRGFQGALGKLTETKPRATRPPHQHQVVILQEAQGFGNAERSGVVESGLPKRVQRVEQTMAGPVAVRLGKDHGPRRELVTQRETAVVFAHDGTVRGSSFADQGRDRGRRESGREECGATLPHVIGLFVPDDLGRACEIRAPGQPTAPIRPAEIVALLCSWHSSS